MGKSVFQLLCLTDVFLLVLSVRYKYQLVQQNKNWADAQDYCRANFIDAAIVQDDIDMLELTKQAQKLKFTSNAWIALYNDIKSWRWSRGDQPLGSFTQWCGTEPGYRIEDCVGFNQWCWFDLPCIVPYPFVCVDGSNNYIVISTAMTFWDAQSYCRQRYVDLSTIKDAAEYLILKQIINGNYWTGLYRDLWIWTGQSNFSPHSHWVSQDPWAASTIDNCGNFINGQFDYADCSKTMPFYCLRDYTRKQFIRMKVKSNQDVNDPAVKAAIIEKIRQKLEEHGLSVNITINWRKQPNGVAIPTAKGDSKGVQASEICEIKTFLR